MSYEFVEPQAVACVDFAMGDEDSYKIVVAGVGAVGKSALTLRLCSGKFPKKVLALPNMLLHQLAMLHPLMRMIVAV